MLYYGVWQLLYVIFTEYIVNLDKDPSQHVRTCRPKRHSRIVAALELCQRCSHGALCFAD